MPNDYLMRSKEVAQFLRISLGTLANWRLIGKGPKYFHVGQGVRYRAADVASWVKQKEAKAS